MGYLVCFAQDVRREVFLFGGPKALLRRWRYTKVAGLKSWKLLVESLHVGGLHVMVATCVKSEQDGVEAAMQVTRQP